MEKLLRVLSYSLWGSVVKDMVSKDDAQELITMAEKQAVSGLIIDALIKMDVRMEQMTLFEAFGYLEQIKKENQRMNHEVAEFARQMAKTGTEYVVVKGQTLAALYPEPLVRMPGDIDFLIKDYQQASKVLTEQWGVELPPQMIEKEVSFTHDNTLYELHTYLIDFGSNKHKRYWERSLAESKPATINIGGEEVKVIEPTLYAVYIFMHLFFHFIKEGIGLRHLCDWAVMMHYYAEVIDKERLRVALQNVGLLKAFLAFGTILVDKLGMKDFPLVLTDKDRKFQKSIQSDIMHSGNFGREKRTVKKAGFKYKLETMLFVVSNCMRYFSLAPKELMLIPYRRFMVNWKLIRA